MRLGWIFAALLAAGCAHQPVKTASGIPNPDTLVVLIKEGWQSLDPAVSVDLGTQLITDNVFESLITFGSGVDDFRPWLATNVPSVDGGGLSPDRLTYTFTIRKGVKFHDGSELTPEDVRYSFLRDIIIGDQSGPPSLLLRPLLGVDTLAKENGKWAHDPKQLASHIQVSGDKVIFNLQQPFPGFLKLVSAWPIVTSKRWAIEHGDWDGDLAKLGDHAPQPQAYLTEHADGTGPFRVVSADVKSHEVRLARNDAYWNGKPALKAAIVRSVHSDALRAIMLQNGDADYVYLDRPALELLKGSEGITILDDVPSFQSGETFFFTFKIDAKDNPRIGSGRLDGKGIPPNFFKDRNVRKGFALAFDYESYLREALGGKGTRASGPIPDSLLGGPGEPNELGFDPEKAKAAFKLAFGGRVWKNGFRMTLAFPRGSVRRHIAADLMKRNVEALNPKFKIDVESLPSGQYMDAYRAHQIPLFVHSWAADYPGAHSMAFQFFDPDGFFAQAQGLADPHLDALERAASREHNAAKRLELYVQLERIAREQVLQIYTYNPLLFKAVRTWVKGLDKDQTVNGLSFLNLMYFAPLSKQ